MTTDHSEVAAVESTQVASRAASPSGIVPKDDHTQVAWFYAVCAVVLLAAGIVIPFTVADGPWLAVLSIMGAFIIVALLSAAAVPHLRGPRSTTRH